MQKSRNNKLRRDCSLSKSSLYLLFFESVFTVKPWTYPQKLFCNLTVINCIIRDKYFLQLITVNLCLLFLQNRKYIENGLRRDLFATVRFLRNSYANKNLVHGYDARTDVIMIVATSLYMQVTFVFRQLKVRGKTLRC